MMRSAVFLCLTVLLVACGQTQAPAPTGSIEVTPGYALLVSPGQSVELTAVVFDGAGMATTDEVTWQADSNAVVTVDANGVASAVASVGSAQIVAKARGLESAPVLILVAQTVPGAVLVTDDQVGGAIEPVDPEAVYDLGWQYSVELTGVVPLAAGDLVVGTGEAPVGGRVLSSTPSGPAQLVTLEIVTLDELFVALVIDQSLDLSHVEPEVPAALAQAYEIRETTSGALEFMSREATVANLTPNQVAGTRALGPFECETDTDFNVELAAAPSFTLTPSFSFDFEYDLAEGGLKKLAAAGSVDATFKFEPTFTAAFEGSLKCEVELFVIPVPIGGPIALVLGGQVPVGAGFELKGKLAVAQVGLQTSAEGKANLSMGINCPVAGDDCETFATGDASLEAKVTPKFPDIDEQFRVEAEFSAYAFADVAVGARLFKRLRVQALRFTASAKQKLDLSTAYAQVSDVGYSSSFDLSLVVQAKIGSDIEKVMKLLKLKVNALSIDLLNVPLAKSPRGSLTISPASVRPGSGGEPGQQATFRVQLDPVTYLGIDSVDKVEIFWKKDGELSEFTLEGGRPGCAEIPATSGQTTFECQADFLPEHEGVLTFYAFVHARLFGVTLPVPLEVANDGKDTVRVDRDVTTPPIGVEGYVRGYINAMAQASCDGDGGDEAVEDIQTDRFEGVASYTKSLFATAQREIVDDNGDPQKVSGDVSITLNVQTTVDGAGNLAEVKGTASGSGQGQASNSQIDNYGVSCYSLVDAGHGHGLGGATTADRFKITGAPVRLDLQASLSFGQVNGVEGVYQRGRFILVNRSTGDSLSDDDGGDDMNFSKSFVLQPGEYSFSTNAHARWRKPTWCDTCSGTADFTYEYTLTFSTP